MKAKSLHRLGLLLLVILAALAGFALRPDAARAAPPDFLDKAQIPTAYRLQVETMALLGIIEGRSDGRFYPNEPVTRQQFAKMVVLAMRIPVSDNSVCRFRDVTKSGPGELYPDNYVAAADAKRIVLGYADGLFRPSQSIILAQAVTMATRAAGRPPAVPPASFKSTWGNFSAAHDATARTAQYNGLLRETGFQSRSPWATTTRAQAAALLFNLMGTDPAGLNGRFLGTSDDLVRYFREKSAKTPKFGVTLEALAKYYVDYGRRFGLRADMAWAQMIHETGFGQYGGDVLPEQNNYAGMGATGGGVRGNSFGTAELGVIAHYTHLAWYVYPVHMSDPWCRLVTQPANGPIWAPGDPRHFVQPDGRPHKGGVRIVTDLNGKWAVPGTTYGQKLQEHASGIKLTGGLW